MSRPSRTRELKLFDTSGTKSLSKSRPSRTRELKLTVYEGDFAAQSSRPSRTRELKHAVQLAHNHVWRVASLADA